MRSTGDERQSDSTGRAPGHDAHGEDEHEHAEGQPNIEVRAALRAVGDACRSEKGRREPSTLRPRGRRYEKAAGGAWPSTRGLRARP
jgi:hypothetical protein